MKHDRSQALIVALSVGALYLALRVVLAERTIDHDEMYNTTQFLTLVNYPHSSGLMTWRSDWKRQLGIHPPFLSLFYFGWVRIFGDSELSLRTPPLAAGLLTLAMTYSIGKHLFNRLVGLLAACGLAVAGSHIAYSLSAIHAIFDMLFMLMALCALINYAYSGKRSDLYWLLLANVVGFTHFYYFITVLVPQAVYLFVKRRSLSVPSSYFLFVCVLSLIFAIPVVSGYQSTYEYTWWGRGSVESTARLLGGLFQYFPDQPHGELTRWSGYLFFTLISASIMNTIASSLRGAENGLVILLVGTFLVPLSIYLVGGWLDRPVGHQRTYFFLLPMYSLLIFAFLEHLLKTPLRMVACSTPLLILILILANSSLRGIYSVSPVVAAIRENRINGRPEGQMLVHDTGNIEWPSRYYLAKLHPGYEASFFKSTDGVRAYMENSKTNGCQTVTVVTADKSVVGELEDELTKDSLAFQADETRIKIPNWFGYSSAWTRAFQVTSRVGRCSTR